jgi:phenylacetate-CoA ligase
MNYGSKSIRSLYYALPQPAKNLISTVYGLQQRRARYGAAFSETLNFLRESQYWSNEKLLDYQEGRVEEFLKEAIPNTPFYQKDSRYQGNSIEEFPLIKKSDLRSELRDFYHRDLKKIPHVWAHTSGTTGSAIVFPVSSEHFEREYAFHALSYEWGGISLTERDKVAFCSGHPVAPPNRQKPPFWVYDYANNWLYFSSYHLAAQNIESYVRELESFQPKMLGGYPSSIYLLALAYEKFGRKNLKLESIFTSSETLLDFQRRKIEEAFDAKIFNLYGNTEKCAYIIECEKGELHLKLEHSAVEVLNESNTPCRAGETGRMVSTCFGNVAFPLIRYDVGDLVTISENQTAMCGRSGILIEKIIGRVEDYIVTPDGRFVGRLDHLFKDSLNIKEAQIVQRQKDEIVIRLVCEDSFGERDEQLILQEARLRLGAEIKIKFETVSEIARASNGKFRFIVSEIPREDLFRIKL